LLRGGSPVKATPVVFAASLLTEDSHEIELRDLEVVSLIPEASWTEASALSLKDGVSQKTLLRLSQLGILVCNLPDPELVILRERDERFRQIRWNRYVSQIQMLTKWSGQFLLNARDQWYQRNMPDSFDDFEKRFGPAPEALPEAFDVRASIDMPLVRKRGRLFQLLGKRRTTRTFDRRRKLSIEDLAVVLFHCFGCHGYKRMSESLTLVKKTSPSGGALHPVDIYPLITRVEGLDPGTYHYNAARHSLELLNKKAPGQVRECARRVVAGQEGLCDANVIFVLAARYGRYFWKYRNHAKAYKVICMDAAHLSQTHYLVCTELGLGAYVTAAIDDKYTESLFGFDGINQGVIAVLGCGIPRTRDPRRFSPERFVPRQTRFPESQR
jgi:putative peptide maturation dehydrogenase